MLTTTVPSTGGRKRSPAKTSVAAKAAEKTPRTGSRPRTSVKKKEAAAQNQPVDSTNSAQQDSVATDQPTQAVEQVAASFEVDQPGCRDDQAIQSDQDAPTQAPQLPAAESDDQQPAPDATADPSGSAGAQSVHDRPEDVSRATTLPGGDPYKILGWSEGREVIHMRHVASGQVFRWSPHATIPNLLKLHPILDDWETKYQRHNNRLINVNAALADILEKADQVGVFRTDRLRGLGVFLDRDRVVVHLGLQLEVDGNRMPLAAIDSDVLYVRREALSINLDVPELSDQEGAEVLALIKDLGWSSAADPLHLAGHVVLGPVGGALPVRPGLQISSRASTGKSYTLNQVVHPLQGAIGLVETDPTEASLRQSTRNGALPVRIDESEASNPRKREQHLRFSRYCYDGSSTSLGTGQGEPLSYRLMSCVCLSGINTPIRNPADRTRFVSISRKPLPDGAWTEVQQRCEQLITPQKGERLIRRTVNHLRTLLANIEVFTQAVRTLLPTGVEPRVATTCGSLLAGAHLLVSTEPLEVAGALQWLQEQGWTYQSECEAGTTPAQQEARDCLEHLLHHRLDKQLVGHLVEHVRAAIEKGEKPDAELMQTLGEVGVKPSPEGLLVANSGTAIERVYARSPWPEGAHRPQLLELPGAHPFGKPTRFLKWVQPQRALLIPWTACGYGGVEDPKEEPAS